MEKIKINTEYIKLQQLLKLASVVSQGSDAKFMIAGGDIKVNGETVLQRGKKIYPGDVVQCPDNICIEVESDTAV